MIQHDVAGHTARFERFAADLLYIIASGKHIDDLRTRKFGEQIEELYRNPFAKKNRLNSADDVKKYILHRLEES